MFGWIIDAFFGPNTAEEARYEEAKALSEALAASDNPDWSQAHQLRDAINREVEALDREIERLKQETGVLAGEIFSGSGEVENQHSRDYQYMKQVANSSRQANAELKAAETARNWLYSALSYL